jgi:hypothetical protein
LYEIEIEQLLKDVQVPVRFSRFYVDNCPRLLGLERVRCKIPYVAHRVDRLCQVRRQPIAVENLLNFIREVPGSDSGHCPQHVL